MEHCEVCSGEGAYRRNIERLRGLQATLGIPKVVVSERGRNFDAVYTAVFQKRMDVCLGSQNRTAKRETD